MSSSAEHASEIEAEFLAGVRANIGPATAKLLGGKWLENEEHDASERLRAAMADRRIYDRGKFARMPHGRSLTVRGFERRWIFGKRVRSVSIASLLAPPEGLLDHEDGAPPVTASELSDHVRKLVTGAKVPHLIGVCSPSGFEDDVWESPPQIRGVRLVLIEPRADGGYRISKGLGTHDAKLCKLFDPEHIGSKIGRVRAEIEHCSTDLLTGSLSAETVAKRLQLPLPLVETGFEMASRADPELRASKRSGELLLFRGAPVASGKEDSSMSLADWIKSLFSKDGEEAKKINVLAERKASLSNRLDRI